MNRSYVELTINQIQELKNYLLGKVLTIVDASIADPEQRKALKDVVREAIWSKEYYTKSIINMVEGKPPYEDNSQPIEEVLKDNQLI